MSTFPTIPTPEFVNKYVRKLWKQPALRQGAEGKDLRKRAFQRLQSFPHACTFKQKDYSVAVYTTANDQPSYVAPLIKPSETVLEDVITMATVSNQDHVKIQRYRAATSSQKIVTIPYDDIYLHDHKVTHIGVHKKNPLTVVFGHKGTSFITSNSMQEYIRGCGGQKPIVFPVLYFRTLGNQGIPEAHAMIMMYLAHNQSLYFLDPMGSKSVLGDYLIGRMDVLRTVFRELYGLEIKEFYNTSIMCPYLPIQHVEFSKGEDQQGLCVLWSLMLMTQYLEFSKNNPARDPLELMKTFYSKVNPNKHPFVQLNRYLRSLYPNHVTKPKCRAGKVWELEKCRTPCRPGKQRSEVTKRCRTPCNPVTHEMIQGRCRPKCKAGTIRHPKTLRCRKECPDTHEMLQKRCVKKCKPTQVRNPVTRRCKKM